MDGSQADKRPHSQTSSRSRAHASGHGNAASSSFAQLVKSERKRLGLTQSDLALRAGVGLRFIRDLEQGKPSLRLDTLNQVLFMFGYRAGPVPLTIHPRSTAEEPHA